MDGRVLWFHCNKCYSLQNNGSFSFTSCGHILCESCLEFGNMVPGQKGTCVVCQRSGTSVLAINSSMRPDLLALFRQPKDLMMEFMQRIKAALEFQNSQRQHLFKHFRNRYVNIEKAAHNAKLEISKRVEHEKHLLAESNQMKREVDNSKRRIQQLERKLAEREKKIHHIKAARSRACFTHPKGNTGHSLPSFLDCNTSVRTSNDWNLDAARFPMSSSHLPTTPRPDFNLKNLLNTPTSNVGFPFDMPQNTPMLLGFPSGSSLGHPTPSQGQGKIYF